MSGEHGDHLELIARWVGGKIVDGKVGIRVRGGPFHGRTRIVMLDESGQPPTRQRALGSRRHPLTDVWHVYELTFAPDTPTRWSYDYAGTEPCNATR
ncbi:hypothetical protein OG223_18010 [Streptomyces sp. NBC_01478]|uniref:hypothetical protein n=1 Tax=Streptomyces sp. NBC_01478 TaxID=2903882 RepID=UPI002E307D23|nr:hypothetical protein [Streptomyces sp. NBC_01478]